jgi:uncharacterized membrane protein
MDDIAPPRESLGESLRRSFVAGIVALLPLFITWKIVAAGFGLVDGVLGNRLDQAISWAIGVPVHVPGLGLIVTVVLVVIAGLLTRKVFFKEIMRGVESLIERVPGVRSLYNAARQVVTPFTEGSKLPFSQVVIVEYPMPGRFTIGLLAKERVSQVEGDDRVVVFFPSNHLHLGYPVLLHRREVQPIDMSVEDAVKFFVSCGVIADEKLVTSDGRVVGRERYEG